MNKFLLTVLLASVVGSAQAADVTYTTGAFSRNGFFSLGTGMKQGMAMRLSKEKLALLKGKQITGIKVLYGSKNVEGGQVTAFLTTELGGTPIATQTQALTTANVSSTTAKWTETTFPQPYTITGEEDCLYLGYEGSMTGAYKLYSTDQTQDAAACSYAIMNDSWIDTNGRGKGMANIKAVLDEVPAHTDALLKTSNLSGYYLAGNAYTLHGQVYNAGTETTQSIDVDVELDQTMTLTYTGLNLQPGQTYDITLPDVSALESGSINMGINVAKVNGAADADMSDNRYAEIVFFYPANMERSLLVESFTGQSCSNCPTGHATMKRVLAQTDQSIVEVAHHAGYNPDNFTMMEDLHYTMFYGSNSTYAPAFMINRWPDANKYIPVQEVSEANILSILSQTAPLHPYASLKLASDYNEETREVKLRLQVYGHEDMGQTQNVLNVVMIQDGMIDIQSNGGSDYEHNHVFRGAVTGNEWGLLADFTPGEVVTYETTFTLPESIRSSYWTDERLASSGKTAEKVTKAVVPSDVHFVGYIARYVDNDPALNYVHNCVVAPLGGSYTQRAFSEGADAITAPEANTQYSIRVVDGRVCADHRISHLSVYDMLGRQHSATDRLTPGLYIIKGIAAGKTISQKVLVK